MNPIYLFIFFNEFLYIYELVFNISDVCLGFVFFGEVYFYLSSMAALEEALYVYFLCDVYKFLSD